PELEQARKGVTDMAKRGALPPSRSKMPSRASKVASRHTPTNSRIKSGGGLTSAKAKKVAVSYGRSSTNIVSKDAVRELGQSLHYKATPLYSGIGPQPDSGNMVAVKTDCKPGGSRTVYARGTNQVHGPVAKGATGLAAPDVPATARSKRGIDDRGRSS